MMPVVCDELYYYTVYYTIIYNYFIFTIIIHLCLTPCHRATRLSTNLGSCDVYVLLVITSIRPLFLFTITKKITAKKNFFLFFFKFF